MKSGIKRKVMASKGWDCHVRWEHGETSYIALKIKEINPDVIIVCNYAFDFYFQPHFEKWVDYLYKKTK